ncbi:MAG: hypothetical protein QOK20_1273, partial [Acidimicrobiaceae bacterium]|nr:hypothetical protein [Acidimicrobiaceae bacterium]
MNGTARRARLQLRTIACAVALTSATLVLVAPVVAPAPALADTTQPACAATDPFTPALAADLAARWPGKHFSAQVFDERTGCQFDLHPELRLTTASVLKVEVMAGILLRAQSQGRPLSAQERSLIQPMITESHDAPTNVLWQSLGGAAGMTNLDHVFGMTGTTQIGPEWGVTKTSASDQVRLLRQVLLGDFGPLGPSYRADAFGYMSSVTPSQRWGISSGLPAGWTFANKNGFAGSICCAWRINSTGVVYSPSGPAYTIAILSDGWPDQPSGIAAVETVSRAVAAKLAAPIGSKVAVGRNAGGALQVFAVNAGGRVLTSAQAGPGQGFGGWSDMGLPVRAAGSPAVGRNQNGVLQVFVRTADNRLLTSWQQGAGQAFGGWADLGLGGAIGGDPTIGVNSIGTLQVFVASTGGQVLSSWQNGPNQGFGG